MAFLLTKRLLSTGGNNGIKTRIEFYYDVISPYTWFAFEVLMRYRRHWNIDVELKPMFLAGVIKATGNAAPMLVPNKAQYMFRDLQRCSKYFDVPLKLVADPFNLIMVKGSIIPSRFLISAYMLYPEKVEALSRCLWEATWNHDEDFTTKEVLTKSALKAGLSEEEVEKVAANSLNAEAKDLLKRHTGQAVEYGSYGSPTIIVHTDEPKFFFGSDRFPLIALELGEVWKGPTPDVVDSHL